MSGSHHGGIHDHGHDHGHSHGPVAFGTAFALGAGLNAIFVAAEIVFGLLAHSTALIADAIHNLGDVLALLLSWAAAWAGQRAPSARRTYGWGRASILAALANAVVLLIGVGAIGIEAARRLADPGPVAGLTVMAVAAAGIAVNGVTAWLFVRGRDDLNVRAAFQHMAADAVVSAGVVAAAGVILLTGWSWIDPLTSLAIVVVIVATTWSTLRQSADLAMDAVPDGVRAQEITDYLRSQPGVAEIHDLHIWAISTTQTALTAHLVSSRPVENEALIAEICHQLQKRFGIGHATLQLETEALAAMCRLRPETVV